jgi:phosphoribosylaminoimidazole (AIR) synthetase
MGCGFCVTVAESDVDAALGLLRTHHPAARRVGTVTDQAGVVTRG